MSSIGIKTGAVRTPVGEKCTVIYENDPKVYNNNASGELQQLQNNPLIQEFASVKPEIYDLVSVTNPTLKMMMDFAKKVMEVKA